MSEEKIIISFDEDKPSEEEKNIIIEVGETDKEADEKQKINPDINLYNLKLNSFFKDNCSLSSFSTSQMPFPSGADNGFGEYLFLDLKDVFLNSLLENNLYIIASSKSGSLYFIDRNNGKLFDKKYFDNESFEKTGFVIHNDVYINSLNSIYKIEQNNNLAGLSLHKIYNVTDKFIIWSNLNFNDGKIIFVEYSEESKTACLRIIECENCNLLFEFKFNVKKYISDSIAVGKNNLLLLFDDKILIVDLFNQNTRFLNLNFYSSEETYVMCPNNKFYFNSPANELLYLDLEYFSGDVNFTGISSSIITSLAGFEDNIFIGNSNGWEVYKSNGALLYNFEDTSENRIESLNKNILAISKQNRIIFHNLNRFQEAEGFTLNSNADIRSNDIISSVKISFDGIFVLTRNGILKAFNSNKLNLHI